LIQYFRKQLQPKFLQIKNFTSLAIKRLFKIICLGYYLTELTLWTENNTVTLICLEILGIVET